MNNNLLYFTGFEDASAVKSDNDSAIYDNVTDATHVPTLFETYPNELLVFGASACIFICIWGILSNIVTIIAFARSPKIRNATVAFIINLCIADIVFCMFTPPLAASTFIHRRWIHGDFLCMLYPMMRYSNFAVSLVTVLIIAINRYVLIAHPKRYSMIFSKFRIAIIIAILWLGSFGLLFPSAIGVWGSLGFDPDTGTCTILSKNGKSPKNMLLALWLIAPTVTFLICYSRIYWLVRQASKSVRKHDLGSNPRAVGTPLPSRRFGVKPVEIAVNLNSQDNPQRGILTSLPKLSKEMKVLRMILVLFCSYMLCFVPISLVKLSSKEADTPVVNVLGYVSAFANACINPLIYVVMSQEYRSAYKNVIFVCRSG